MEKNTVIIGKTGAGKTSLTNDLIQQGLTIKRVTIEDCAELPVPNSPFYNVQASKGSENE